MSQGRHSARPTIESLEGRSLLSAIEGLAAGASTAERMLARPQRSASSVVRDVVYRTEGDRPERLDVYRPSGEPPPGGWPVVLAIHGGGWRRFSKDSYGPKVSPLLRYGYAIVAPDYTLSAPGRSSWPENIVDLRAALRWIGSNGAGLGLNSLRVAAMGESSGAHLALLLGTDQDASRGLPRVNAVVDYYGPADLIALDGATPGGTAAVHQFLGGPSAAIRSRYIAASPIEHVTSDDPPVLLVQGTADPIVPASQSEAMALALRRAGVGAKLIELSGVGHGFGFQVGGRNLLSEVVGFLNSSLASRAVTSR
jgi:acetyl esterase/lipase